MFVGRRRRSRARESRGIQDEALLRAVPRAALLLRLAASGDAVVCLDTENGVSTIASEVWEERGEEERGEEEEEEEKKEEE